MKYGTIVPMGGGLTIGNCLSTKKRPSFFIGYSAFTKPQENIRNYFNDVKFYDIENKEEIGGFLNSNVSKKVDFISCVCPCSGLSTANVHFNSDAKQNDWMIKTAEFALQNVKPNVFVGENSVLLVGNTGRKIIKKLIVVAQKYGYSFSTYKTSTILHGLPQNRKRSFYFFWKSNKVPIMNFYNKPYETIEQILSKTNKKSKYYNIEVNDNMKNHPSILFLKEFFGNNWRKEIYNLFKTRKVTDVLSMTKVFENYNDIANNYLEWLNKNNFDKEYDLIKNKVLLKKRFWDEHPYLQKEIIGAISYRLLTCFLHPFEDRSLNVRETMDLMGYPNDFEVINENYLALTQSVPITTSIDITNEIVKFINGELVLSNQRYLYQDNIKKNNFSWNKILEEEVI